MSHTTMKTEKERLRCMKCRGYRYKENMFLIDVTRWLLSKWVCENCFELIFRMPAIKKKPVKMRKETIQLIEDREKYYE